MTLGDPRDAATVLGPVISARHRERIEAHDRTHPTPTAARSPPAVDVRPELDTGWYVEPTVFR